MSDSKKYLTQGFRARLFIAASDALYWPMARSDDEFEPARIEYLSTPSRNFIRLAHPEAVKAILQEVERLEKLVVDFQEASGLWHGMGETDRITPEHVREFIQNLSRERDARTKQRDDLVEALKSSAEVNVHAMDKIAVLQEENKQFRKRAADAELAYNNLQMECRHLNEENAQLYAQQDVARDTYEALVAENQQLRAALDETIATLTMADKGLQEFDGRITRLEKFSKETSAELTRLEGRESYIEMLEEDLDEVLDQVDADIEEIDRLKQENARLANTAENMAVDYGQLQLQLEAQKETALAMIQQRENSITKHMQENADLRAQLAEKVRLLDIYETKYVTKTSLDIMTKAYKEANQEVERLKAEITAERATNFGEGAWVAVEAYNKVAHALAEVCDIAETLSNYVPKFPEHGGPTMTDRRIQQLREIGQKCYFPPFETAWLCEQIAHGYQYGEDALEQVRMGYEIARKWLQHLGEP